MKKKTILYVHQSSDLYGSDKALLLLVVNLNKDLFMPIVVLPKIGPLLKELQKNNILVIVTPVLNIHKKMFNFKELFLFPIQLVKSILKLNGELKSYKIDFIQSNTVVVTLGFIYARLKGIKHFWHIHEVLESPKIAVKVFSWLVKVFGDVPIFNSIATQNSFCEEYPKIREKSVVIYNGLERKEKIVTNLEEIQLKESLKLKSNDIILGLIGRINENKGHSLLLNSFKKVQKKHPNTKLLFVGSTVKGKEYILENIKDQIKKLGLDTKVFIISFQKDIWKFWDILDIAIVPSTISESFGLVALEAMLSSKPVIASNLGALKEVVEADKTGVLFDQNEEESLGKAITLLIENKSLREKYGVAGFQRAVQYFTLENYINQFEKSYLKN